MKAVASILLAIAFVASAQILPPAGEEIKGPSLKIAIQKIEAAGIKELKTSTDTVKLSDLTALSASSARFMNSTGIGRIALADLPEPVRKQLGYDPTSAAGHDQAKQAMTEKATSDAARVVQAQRDSAALASLREKLKVEVNKGSLLAEVTINQTLSDGVLMNWVPADRDPNVFTPSNEGFLLGNTRQVADGEKLMIRLYPAGRYKAKRAISGAESVIRAWCITPEASVARLEKGEE